MNSLADEPAECDKAPIRASEMQKAAIKRGLFTLHYGALDIIKLTGKAMIREVTVADAHAICRIYNHYVINTTISFEEEAVTSEAMAGRIAARTLPWLVHEEGGEVVAYAYATPWRVRAGYRFAAESSVYVAAGATGRKLGLGLYHQLLGALRGRGICSVIGGVALPNDASVALHEKFGFHKVAHFERVGWKHGRWIDVAYWQLQLIEDQTPAASPPRP